ncbi:dihydroorotase family protein [Micromonospora sp. CPCC 205371]|nr:dihydroorotase family protein [Micromonospora sp. CPCC 205371]
MELDLAVQNAVITIAGMGTFEGSLGVKDGKVAALTAGSSAGAAKEVVDARGMHLLPGVFDAHSHYGLGGDDDFSTETRAAARAGITSTLSYLLKLDTDYESPYLEMRREGEAKSLIDFGFHFGVSSIEQAKRLTWAADQFGVVSHKYFMSFKRPGEGDYLGVHAVHDGILYQVMREVAKDPRVILVVHSENIEVVWSLADELRSSGADGLAAWNDSRPDFTEAHDIGTVGMFSELTGAKVFIPHVSSAMALEAAKRFASNRPILETCPHFLTHTCDDEYLGSLGKVNPPLRPKRDVEALWEAVFDGTIDLIASDHNSRKRANKSGDIWSSSAGFPGQGTMLPAILTEGVVRRGLALERAVELLCASPARIFGHYPRKGTLLPGSDADFVVVDLETWAAPDTESWGSFSDYSLHEREELAGWPVATYLRGRRIWSTDDGWTTDPAGEFLPATPVEG